MRAPSHGCTRGGGRTLCQGGVSYAAEAVVQAAGVEGCFRCKAAFASFVGFASLRAEIVRALLNSGRPPCTEAAQTPRAAPATVTIQCAATTLGRDRQETTITLNAILQLADSEGLGRIVLFTGLEYPALVRPTVHGEPLLTAQSIYFLDKMEAVAHVRGNTHDEDLPETKLEYLIDNYLFEFCKRHPKSRMSFKIGRGAFWLDDPASMYIHADHGHTQTLALDKLNDPAVKSIGAVDPEDDVDLSDWDIGRNYGAPTVRAHIERTGEVLKKKVRVLVLPTDERDGYIGRLRVIKALDPYIDYFQARALEDLGPDGIRKDATEVSLTASEFPDATRSLHIERIHVSSQHNPTLLSHFFSGVKELNPLKGFLSFYNVLEYYFEEAPRLLSRTAPFELAQLKCTIELLAEESDVRRLLDDLDSDHKRLMTADLGTSSGVHIKQFDTLATSLRDELSRWLYDIRCAVVHTKKTRKGAVTPSFEPYSEAVRNVHLAIPIVRALAILCIEKDTALQHAR